jgi:hypothetical protein
MRRHGYHALRCATCGYAVTTCARLGCRPPAALPDATPIKTLGQLNRLLREESQGWTLVRAREGYYYFVHPEHSPSEGVYVFSCRDTSLGYWRRELREMLERRQG